MRSIPKISPCGDAALTVEFRQIVDAQINSQVLGLDAEIGRSALTGVIETAPTYASVLVYFDPLLTSFGRLRDQIYDLNTRTTPIDDTGDRWTIPVCYGGDHGFDLDGVSELHQLDPAEVTNRHAAPDYRVYMIGFLPGFAYLGGLDPTLFTPRRPPPPNQSPCWFNRNRRGSNRCRINRGPEWVARYRSDAGAIVHGPPRSGCFCKTR